MVPRRLPSATYRVQLNQDFRFADALRILDYLHELGISDLYLSPVVASRKGSGHGYDVTDPTRLNPDLGSEEDFAALQTELQNRGMGMLLDTVPNHMAASAENPWWMDVLENGAQSAFAAFFDIEWHPHSPSLDGKILLPVLGRPFGEALDSAEIRLIFQDGRFFIQYFDSLFPLSPRSYFPILNHRIEHLKKVLGEDAAPFHEYSGILASVQELSRADRRAFRPNQPPPNSTGALRMRRTTCSLQRPTWCAASSAASTRCSDRSSIAARPSNTRTPDLDRFATLVDRPYLLSIMKSGWSAAVVREPMVWYRHHEDGARHATMTADHVLHLLRTYRDCLPARGPARTRRSSSRTAATGCSSCTG